MGEEIIFETASEFELARVKSLLEEEGINYVVKERYLQNVFGDVGLWVGKGIIGGSFKVVVASEDASRALMRIREVLEGIDLNNT